MWLHRSGPALRWLFFTIMATRLFVGGADGARAYRIREAAAPFAFGLVSWEAEQVSSRIGPLLLALRGALPRSDTDDVQEIRAYFSLPEPLRATARRGIEPALSVSLRMPGSQNRWPAPRCWAPEPPPFPAGELHLLGPASGPHCFARDRIAVQQYVLLRPMISSAAATDLERMVESGGVSSIVTPIGGLATYPSMVLGGSAPVVSLSAIAHEWVHAYFFFHPLGQTYWSTQEMRTINETAAELAGNELGRALAVRLGLADPIHQAEASHARGLGSSSSTASCARPAWRLTVCSRWETLRKPRLIWSSADS